MKQAYISLVLNIQSESISDSEVSRLDTLLSLEARRHEIILIQRADSSKSNFEGLILSGPFTIVYTQSSVSRSDSLLAGMGRAVGDFVIEWNLDTTLLDSMTVSNLMDHTDLGAELVEGLFEDNTLITRFSYKIINKLRPKSIPLQKSATRLFSRRALNWILEASHFESQYLILVAELPFKRKLQTLSIKSSNEGKALFRFSEAISLLIRGSRFGTVIPLVLATISSVFAIGVAVYALLTFILFGTAAEGWTSIAVVTGLGQGAILALIGMVWARLDALSKGLSRRSDPTAFVEVYPSKV